MICYQRIIVARAKHPLQFPIIIIPFAVLIMSSSYLWLALRACLAVASGCWLGMLGKFLHLGIYWEKFLVRTCAASVGLDAFGADVRGNWHLAMVGRMVLALFVRPSPPPVQEDVCNYFSLEV